MNLIGKIPKLSMKLIVELGSLSINDDTLKDTVERDNVLTRKRILETIFMRATLDPRSSRGR